MATRKAKNLDPNAVERFIFPEDEGDAQPTVWLIRKLTRTMRIEVDNSTAQSQDSGKGPAAKSAVGYKLGDRRNLIVKYGLIGWENFDGPAFATEYNKMHRCNVAADRSLDVIEDSDFAKLAAHIDEDSVLAEKEVEDFAEPAA